MPRKSRKSKKILKKKKRSPYSRVPRLLGDFIVTKMRYVSGVTLNPGAAAITSRVFRANGITVVGTTSGVGQPTGFDQFNAFFKKYRIISSTCKMTHVPNTLTNVIPGVYGVFLDDDASLGYADYQTLMMGNQSKTKNVKLAGILNGATDMKPTSASYNAKKVYKHLSTSRDLVLGGDAALNPDESQYYQCWYGSPDLSVDPGAAHFLFQLDYVVEWYDKKLTIGSDAPA